MVTMFYNFASFKQIWTTKYIRLVEVMIESDRGSRREKINQLEKTIRGWEIKLSLGRLNQITGKGFTGSVTEGCDCMNCRGKLHTRGRGGGFLWNVLFSRVFQIKEVYKRWEFILLGIRFIFEAGGGGRVGSWYFRGLLLSRTRNFYVMCYRGKHAGLPPIRRQANKSSRTWCRGFARLLRHRSPGSLPICYHLRRTYWNTSRRCKLMVLILGKMVVGFLLRKNHKKFCFKMSLFSTVNCAKISTCKYFCFSRKDNSILTVTPFCDFWDKNLTISSSSALRIIGVPFRVDFHCQIIPKNLSILFTP